MTDERKINKQNQTVSNADPSEAEPGRGAPGKDHHGVQMAQNPAVNPPEETIPGGAEVEDSKQDVAAVDRQEAGTGVTTTSGYVVGESGALNNVAIEPEMYTEEQ